MRFFKTSGAIAGSGSALTLFTPAVTFAAVGLRETVTLFLYATVGFFGAAALLLFSAGLLIYMVRLGTVHREDGVEIMAWGVSVMFIVMCLSLALALVE